MFPVGSLYFASLVVERGQERQRDTGREVEVRYTGCVYYVKNLINMLILKITCHASQLTRNCYKYLKKNFSVLWLGWEESEAVVNISFLFS